MIEWTQHKDKFGLTTVEQENALRRAAIPLDPTEWDEQDCLDATIAFVLAERNKIEGLLN